MSRFNLSISAGTELRSVDGSRSLVVVFGLEAEGSLSVRRVVVVWEGPEVDAPAFDAGGGGVCGGSNDSGTYESIVREGIFVSSK